MVHELATTLTDFGLAAECGVFAWLLAGTAGPVAFWFRLLFASVGGAAALGGAVHGFFPDAGSTAGTTLWTATLLLTGVTALAACGAGAHLRFPARVAGRIVGAASVRFVLYCAVVLLVSREFVVAIVDYVPAAAFLLVVLALEYRRRRETAPLLGAIGLALALVGSALQQAPIAGRNALYHATEAVALLLLFSAARHGGATCSSTTSTRG